MSNTQKKSGTYRRPVIITASILVIVGIFVVLEFTNVTHFIYKKASTSTQTTANSPSKGETATDTSNQSSGNQSAQNQGTVTGDNKTTPSISATLITPTGTFVSNHHPSDTSQTETSVCNTTTGATCQIVLTQGDLVKSLAAQTTDRGGVAYWTWTPKEVGLSSGNWSVQAKATLGSQVKTADDAINLVIVP